jgi:predicted MFS family arabinose efflux permease
VAGILTQYLDWRWCLYTNVPIAVLAAFGARAVLADTRTPFARGGSAPLDVIGLVLGSGGLVAIVFGCAQAATLGWTAPAVLVLVATGAVALALFVAHEARCAAPLLPLHVVLDRQRGASYASALLAVAAMFGAFLFLTYLLQVVMGFSPLLAGVAFLPMTISSFVAGTMLAPRLLPRTSARVLMTPGFLVAAIGMALLTRLHAGTQFVSGILPAEILLGVGIASVMMPASSVATSRLKPQVVGVAAATLNSAQQIGAALGVLF